ncbi:hypothetical protein, partial [Paenibacillus silagei]
RASATHIMVGFSITFAPRARATPNVVGFSITFGLLTTHTSQLLYSRFTAKSPRLHRKFR